MVRFTPPGPACSIGFGTGTTDAPPGSGQGMHLAVGDIEAARTELTGRGVAVSEVRHMGSGGWVPGPDPQRRHYQSFADFSDPDAQRLGVAANSWCASPPAPRRPDPVSAGAVTTALIRACFGLIRRSYPSIWVCSCYGWIRQSAGGTVSGGRTRL
ncbi:MAG TPA: hypothetical protein VFX70_19165 [Mycobacteriales bacterium]|nr:hypothetical protein [Mycobacteriales bacterium]